MGKVTEIKLILHMEELDSSDQKKKKKYIVMFQCG